VGPGDSGRLDARASGLAILAMAILGGSFTAGRLAVQDLPVLGMLALRMALTGGTLAVYAWRTGVRLAFGGRARAFLAAHTVLFVLSQVLLYFGLILTGAGRAAILFNLQPFFTLLVLPLFVPAERLTPRRWAGTAVAFAGAALVLGERGLAGGSLTGDLLCLLGALGWTGSVILNKTMPRELSAPAVILWPAVAAVPVLALLSAALEPQAAWGWSAASVAGVLYLGVIAGGAGFVLVVWLTITYSASRVNAFVFLTPVFGVAFAWIVLGESIGALQVLGALAVAAGILVVSTER
jgi:drug/metabolite transporter (DMT)-like permease